jgi:hypothetical protein
MVEYQKAGYAEGYDRPSPSGGPWWLIALVPVVVLIGTEAPRLTAGNPTSSHR